MNIVEPIFLHCRSKPAEVALISPGTEFNIIGYGRLAHAINNVCQRVISLGLGSGTRVAVFISDPILHAVFLIALTRLGLITISGRNRSFSWRFAIDAVIADQVFPNSAARFILVDREWVKGDGHSPDPQHFHHAHPDDICRIFLTSGTTGEEKGVAVSHHMMVSRINRQDLFFGPQSPFCGRTYLDLSLTTSLGFQTLLATLWRGGVLLMTGDSEATIKAIPRYKIQNMVGSPKGLMNFFEAVERRPEYRSGLEAVFTGGSILSEALSERVRARLCSNLTNGYGSTEATMVASMPAHFAKGITGAMGYILPGMKVEIVDDEGRILPIGSEGAVRIQSEYGVTEYLDDPEETDRVFRNGWFYPGDFGHFRNDGLLVISGRTRNVLNLGGEKINPEKVENTISMHPNIAECAVLAAPNEFGVDELSALVVARAYLNREALVAFCEANLPAAFRPVRFIAVAALPRNEMGKVDRSALSKLIEKNSN